MNNNNNIKINRMIIITGKHNTIFTRLHLSHPLDYVCQVKGGLKLESNGVNRKQIHVRIQQKASIDSRLTLE